MSNKYVSELGNVTVLVPASSSIVVFTRGDAQVSSVVGYPNHPETLSLLGVVSNGQTTFGPFAAATYIRIDAGATSVAYDVGTAPFIGTVSGIYQVTPVAINATAAITVAGLTSGIVTSTTAAAVAGTLPTGTELDAASNLLVSEAFDWFVITTGANAFTVTAAAGHTIVGTAVVATVTSGHFRTRKTAAATYVTYRMS